MNELILSIITPTHNSGKTLLRYFNSLPRECSELFEIIIVDNNSLDDTLDIVNKYRNYFSIKVYQKGDKGIYDAMNIGVILSNGFYLYFLNSDDWLETNNFCLFLEHLLPCNYELFIFHQKRWVNSEKYFLDRPIFSKILDYTFPHQSLILSKKLFFDFGPYDLSFKVCADYDLLIKIFLSGVSPQYINNTLVNFSTTGYSSRISTLALYRKEVLKIWKKHNIYTQYKYLIFTTRTIGLLFRKLQQKWAGRGSNPEPTD